MARRGHIGQFLLCGPCLLASQRIALGLIHGVHRLLRDQHPALGTIAHFLYVHRCGWIHPVVTEFTARMWQKDHTFNRKVTHPRLRPRTYPSTVRVPAVALPGEVVARGSYRYFSLSKYERWSRQMSFFGVIPARCRSSAEQSGSWDRQKNLEWSGKRAYNEAAHSLRAATRCFSVSVSVPVSTPTTLPTPCMHTASTISSPRVSSPPSAGMARIITSPTFIASRTASTRLVGRTRVKHWRDDLRRDFLGLCPLASTDQNKRPRRAETFTASSAARGKDLRLLCLPRLLGHVAPGKFAHGRRARHARPRRAWHKVAAASALACASLGHRGLHVDDESQEKR
eukprot:scaffold263786_cov36-Tisochrysis_lutea.AAC.1